jgi:hypothetical protein
MSVSTRFWLLIVGAIVCVGLAVYYLIPGIYHPLTFSPPNESHLTHGLAFFALAAVALIAARFVRSSSSPPQG